MGTKNKKLKSLEEIRKFKIGKRLNYIFDNLTTLIDEYGQKKVHTILSGVFDCAVYDFNKEDQEEVEKVVGGKEGMEDNKNATWSFNHMTITSTVINGIKEHGRILGATEIANTTGLSRVTVNKHLKSFNTSVYYQEQKQTMKMTVDSLMVWLRSLASNGDIKAATLFLKYAERFYFEKLPQEQIPQQTYIQINNIYVTEEAVKALPAEKRKAIEEIFLIENLKDQEE